MTKHLTLYGFILCPYVQRVRMALESLNIAFDYIEVDLLVNEQRSEEYLKINPFGKVPSIAVDGKIIYESLALLEYLENEIGGIFPKDNIEKTQNRIWGSYLDSVVISKLNGLFGQIKTKDEEAVAKIATEVLELIRFFVKNSGLVENLEAHPEGYFAGNTLSYIDFVIAPFARFHNLILDLISKKTLVDYAEKDDKLIATYLQYVSNVHKSEAYQAITDKLKQLPPLEKSSTLKHLNIDSLENYNYETVVKGYFVKRFQ